MAHPARTPSPFEDPGLVPQDEALPSVPLLLGPDAVDVLGTLVRDGGMIVSAQPRFVMYRPGSRITVRYWARFTWPNGRSKSLTVVATERTGQLPEGAIPVERAGTTIGVWAWPRDPRLPGLRAAADPNYIRSLLDAYGAPPGRLYLRTMSYWPGQRAVIQVTLPSQKLRFERGRGRVARAPARQMMFVKVVRPGEVQPLYELHAALHGALPVALCPGGSEEHGLLVFQALPGVTLGSTLPHDAGAAPDGSQLLGLMGSLSSFQLGDEPRVTTGHKVGNHVRLLKAVMPSEAEALDRFADAYGEERPQPLTTVHGDFHESQVLVQQGRISGLLDVDDAGPGQLVDDLALLLGRVVALSRFGEGDRESIRLYGERLLESFSGAVDGKELRRRVAGSLIGRATVPFRSQEPGWPAQTRERIRFAEEWIERCRRDGVLD